MKYISVSMLAVLMLTALCLPASAQTCSTPSFTEAPVYPVGGDIRSVAVADFDGDGRPDLAVANADSSSVSVLERVGRSDPAINNTYTVGTFPLTVVTGDFTYGDTTSPNVAGTVPIVRLNEFLGDSQQIGQGVGWSGKLAAASGKQQKRSRA